MVTLEKNLLRIEVTDDSPEDLLYNYQKALVLTARTILSCKDNFLSEDACEYFPFLLDLLAKLNFDELQLREIGKLMSAQYKNCKI
ncbi:MAG: hypothetical protein H6585_10225 [Flavobacteriales bacterium]|nr:hypothetical protein [Flavobacteriales bacterium]